ncbi:MAG TPA: beta-ketoacyl-ACP synthase II [Candidatus Omnitrophota bacterium]|nr:beta-ketoacyl-ACP synthase II [Candidatus Omnitrophota bacterium]
MNKQRVVVTGMGVLSPVGSGVEKFWAGLLAGKSGIHRIDRFDPTDFPSQICGDVRDYNPADHFDVKEARHLSRFIQLGVVAAREAIKQSQLNTDSMDQFRCGVVVGSGVGALESFEHNFQTYLSRGPKKISPFFIPQFIVNEACGQIAIEAKAKGLATCVVTACATASNAIGDAFRLIQYGEQDIVIAGGTEAANTPMGVGGFSAIKALSQRNDAPEKASRPFDAARDGFVMGEGAGIVVLESLEHAQKRGAKILAELVGYGRTSDAYHITAPEPNGEGAIRAMVSAIQDAQLKPEDISYINAHGTSTELNDKVETLAIKKTFGEYAYRIPVSSTKSMTGHLLGAAGGVEFIASVLATMNNIVPPTINYENPDPNCDLDYVPNQARQLTVNAAMSNSLGFGGHNASLIVKKFQG